MTKGHRSEAWVERLYYKSHIQPGRASLLREGLFFLGEHGFSLQTLSIPLFLRMAASFHCQPGLDGELGREKLPVSWFKYRAQGRKSKRTQPGAQKQRFPCRSKLTAVLRMQ